MGRLLLQSDHKVAKGHRRNKSITMVTWEAELYDFYYLVFFKIIFGYLQSP